MDNCVFTPENVNSLIEKMVLNEKTTKHLYTAYAKHFPSHRTLWSSMAGEEQLHAEILALSKANIDIQKQPAQIDFTEAAVDVFVEYVKKHHRRLIAGSVNVKQALATTINIERSMLESHYFDVLDLCRNPDIKRTLYESTKNHVEQVKKAFNDLLKADSG